MISAHATGWVYAKAARLVAKNAKLDAALQCRERMREAIAKIKGGHA